MKIYCKVGIAALSLFIGSLLPMHYSYADTTISSNITTNTTWTTAGSVYVVSGQVAVNSGVTLTIDPGVVVKFQSNTSSLTINGILNAQGAATSSIYFTSYKDDTVGGDTNGDSTSTSPVAGNWKFIGISATGVVNLSHAVIRYGGAEASAYVYTNVFNDGGILTISTSTVSHSAIWGIRQSSGTTTATTVTFSNQATGLYVLGGNVTLASSTVTGGTSYGVNGYGGTLTLTNNDFIDNTYAAYISDPDILLSSTGNMATSTSAAKNGVYITGTLSGDRTWAADTMPYIPDAMVISSGATLTVNAGAVLKFFTTTSSFTVAGSLYAGGSTSSPIYFTSYKDDTVGGDTNGNGSSNAPAAGDWKFVGISSGGAVNFSGSIIRYGGAEASAYLYTMIYNDGGVLSMDNSTVASSTNYGIRQVGGTTTAWAINVFGNTNGIYQSAGYSLIYASSTIHDNTYGIYVTGGGTHIASNSIYDNSNKGVFLSSLGEVLVDVCYVERNDTGIYIGSGSPSVYSNHVLDNDYGIYSLAATPRLSGNIISGNTTYGIFKNSGSSITAKYNYWGASDGPSGAGPGSGDVVSANIIYENFLSQPHYIQTDVDGAWRTSVVSGSIDWEGDPGYWTEWYAAVETWNNLGSIDIATDTIWTSLELEVASTTRSDLGWAGLWDDRATPNHQLTLNAYYLSPYSSSQRESVIAHELGHSLGLGHSYSGNVMFYTVGEQDLGAQDTSDYNYLWP